MNVDLPALIPAIFNELDRIVENASDVFLVMILQMVALINNASVFVIVTAEVGSGVDDVSEAMVFENLGISSHKIATQVHEVIYYCRADMLVVLVFIFLARRATVSKVLIAELLGRDLQVLHAVGLRIDASKVDAAISVALTLPLTARRPKFLVVI